MPVIRRSTEASHGDAPIPASPREQTLENLSCPSTKNFSAARYQRYREKRAQELTFLDYRRCKIGLQTLQKVTHQDLCDLYTPELGAQWRPGSLDRYAALERPGVFLRHAYRMWRQAKQPSHVEGCRHFGPLSTDEGRRDLAVRQLNRDCLAVDRTPGVVYQPIVRGSERLATCASARKGLEAQQRRCLTRGAMTLAAAACLLMLRGLGAPLVAYFVPLTCLGLATAVAGAISILFGFRAKYSADLLRQEEALRGAEWCELTARKDAWLQRKKELIAELGPLQ